MPTETCLKLPQNFAQREEVRRFIAALRADGIAVRDAHHVALMVMFEFAAQEKEFRPLDDSFGRMLSEFTGFREMMPDRQVLAHELLVQRLIESGLLIRDTIEGAERVTCPLFNAWNPHLLPGFESMHQKGAREAQRKRETARDRDTADAHLRMFERQGMLNLGQLDASITKDEIAAALCLIMRIDRAGGCAARPSNGYEIWMIAAASRFLRTAEMKDADVLCDFLLAGRIDPTVPKGAEVVLPVMEQLLQRAKA